MRGRGALAGAGLCALLPAMAAAVASMFNPWFLDALPSFLLLAFLPAALVGAVLGAVVGRGRRGPVLLLLALTLVLGARLRPRPGPIPELRLLVFGIDGATWDLIDHLDAAALDALSTRGSRGILTSAEPMFSPLLWTTMASGRIPDEHGIHGFRTRSDQCRVARFWDVAAAAGMKVGLYKWLVTWPPPALQSGGFVVPAWLAPSPETRPTELSFIKEIELSRRLKRKRFEAVRPAWRLVLAGIPQGLRWSSLVAAAEWSLRERFTHPTEPERAWRLQLLRVWMDRDVFVARLHSDRPAVATFTTYAIDALGHTHWALVDCTSDCPPWAGALAEAYAQADAVLGEVMADLGPLASVVVLSDHGFRAIEAADAGGQFAPRTERLRARLIAAAGQVDVAKVGHKVAVTLLEEDAAAQRARVEAALGELVQGSTGEPFYRWESMPGTERAIGLTLRDEKVTADRLETDTVGGEPLSDYVVLTEAYSGVHDAAGILVVAGPAVPHGLRDAGLLDVAPTLLGLLGLPAAEDMPGRVLFGEELPRVGSHDGLVPVGGAALEGEVDEEALRALGYLE